VADDLVTSALAPTLIEISGIADLRDDDDVVVKVYSSASPLERTGTGKPLAWSSLDISPEKAFTAEAKGKIHNGKLITEPFTVRVHFREQIVDTFREMRRARLTITFNPDGSITGGIAGYQSIDGVIDSYRQSTQIGADLTHLSCPALIGAVRRAADADPDPKTGQNTAISSALRFRGIPAFAIRPTQMAQVTP